MTLPGLRKRQEVSGGIDVAKCPTISADLTFLAQEEGGRKCVPNLNAGWYMPHLVARSGNYLGVRFVAGPSVIEAGRSGRFTLELMYPDVDYAELQPGTDVTVREGSNTVASGVIVESP